MQKVLTLKATLAPPQKGPSIPAVVRYLPATGGQQLLEQLHHFSVKPEHEELVVWLQGSV